MNAICKVCTKREYCEHTSMFDLLLFTKKNIMDSGVFKVSMSCKEYEGDPVELRRPFSKVEDRETIYSVTHTPSTMVGESFHSVEKYHKTLNQEDE